MLQRAKDDYYENWTMNEIKYVERHYRSISSAIQNRKNELLKICDQSSIQQSFSTQASHSSSSSIFITLLYSSTSTSRHYDIQSNRQYESSRYTFAKYAKPSSVNHPRQISQSDDQNHDYQTLELYALSSSSKVLESYVSSSLSKTSYEKELSTLNKLHKTKKKFEDTKNNFDFKLTIYLDKCRHADLSEHAYEKEIFVMLIDEALTRYYANKTNFITFNDFCTSMRTYFESLEWQSHNLDK